MTWAGDEASIQVDCYLDGLLALRAGPVVTPEPLAAELVRAAEAVRDALVRVHPSFRFEEALAGRLRSLARGTAVERTVVLFPAPMAVAASDDDLDAAPDTGERGWVLLGGAIASGVSLVAGLAGVVLARRRTRGDHPLERPA